MSCYGCPGGCHRCGNYDDEATPDYRERCESKGCSNWQRESVGGVKLCDAHAVEALRNELKRITGHDYR